MATEGAQLSNWRHDGGTVLLFRTARPSLQRKLPFERDFLDSVLPNRFFGAMAVLGRSCNGTSVTAGTLASTACYWALGSRDFAGYGALAR